MKIYIEPYLPQQRLVLIGQGGKDDVEEALVKLGKMLDFEVIVIDHAPVLSEQPDKLITAVDYDVGTFDFGNSDSVVVLTRGERDIETLQKLSKFKLRYVGMLSSRRRVTENVARLRAIGVREDFVASLRAPAGADIGGITAAEIALSIVAEVVAGKYSKDIIRMALEKGSKPPHIESRGR